MNSAVVATKMGIALNNENSGIVGDGEGVGVNSKLSIIQITNRSPTPRGVCKVAYLGIIVGVYNHKSKSKTQMLLVW